jgi:hypothetical protein
MSYHPTQFHVTGPQLVRLYHGHQVQIPKEHLQKSTSHVLVHHLTAKRIMNAHKKGTGVRIGLSKHEITHMNGKGWFSDAWNYLRQKVPEVGHWIVENVPKIYNEYVKPAINSEFYQTKVRPVLHEKLHEKLESAPYANYSIPAADWLGDETKAFGMKKKRATAGRIIQQRQKKITGSSFRN